MAIPLLDVRGVTLQYKTRDHLVTATYRVDFEVLCSDRFVLLGPSGCGKTTLLKAVGGYMKPVEGEIRLKGKVIDRPGPDRMMVFQEFNPLPAIALLPLALIWFGLGYGSWKSPTCSPACSA